MSLYRPIKSAAVSDRPVRLRETGPAQPEFVPTWLPAETVVTHTRRFPRNWTEVEAIIEDRLAQFEERNRLERERSFEQGVQEGMRRQEAVVQKKLEAAREPLAKVAAAVEQELALGREAVYRQVTRLAAALSEALLRHVVAVNPYVFIGALRDALEPLAHQDAITVRLNPADSHALRAGMAAEAEEFLEFSQLKIVADPKVSAGSAVAESAGGSVDCRTETRIKQVLQIIDTEPNASS